METVSIILGSLAYLVGLAGLFAGLLDDRRLKRGAVVGGWVGVIVTAALTSLDVVGGAPAVLAGGGFGAVAAVPLGDEHGGLMAPLVVPVATAWTMATGSVGVAVLSDVAPWRAATTLYVVLFAGVSAAVSLYGSGAFRGWSQPGDGSASWAQRMTVSLVASAGVVTSVVGVWMQRGPGAEGGGVPLVDPAGEALVWRLPSGIEPMSVTAYDVFVPVPEWILWVGLGLAVAIVAGGIVERLGASHARIYWGVLAVFIVSAAVVAGASAAMWVEMPSASAFISRAETALSQAELPQRLAGQGEFSSMEPRIDWLGLLPLGLGCWWSALVCGGLALTARHETKETEVRPSVPAIRAGMVLWASWLVSALIHWRLAGVVGFQSPSEWVGLGVVCVAGGASLVAIDSASGARDRVDAQARLSTGAAVGLMAVLMAVSLSIWSGVPIFLSLPA